MEGNTNNENEYHEAITDKKEVDALNNFKTALATITDKKDKAVINPMILLDDDLLIHFLRARKLNIKKAVKMMIDYLHWKTNIKLDCIYNDFVLQKKFILESEFPHSFHKMTKKGNPIYIQVLGLLNPERLFKEIKVDDLITYSIQIYERLERDLYRICSQKCGKYIHGVFNIIDFKGINMSILNKNLISYLKQSMKVCQDYFPESLEGCMAINAGLAFRALYTTCKVFLDSKTKKKIKVYGNNYQNAILEIVDSESLPFFLGGKCQCPQGCMFSNEGPWKTEESNEEIPEEVLKKRKEITDILNQGKIQTSKDDEIKDPKQQSNGVSGEDFN